MDTYEEKKSLLLEMIAFAIVDGNMKKKDYDFLFSISNILDIEKGGFNELLQQELPDLSSKTKLKRIQQFYRLALLMNKDLDSKELGGIQQLGINMGLNPEISKRILKKIKKSPETVITDEILLKILKEEQF
jgi:hypothetical protein